MRIRLSAMAVLSLVLLPASGQAQAPWTVYGIELGQPVALPACKHKTLPNGQPSQYIYEDDPAETCHEPEIQLRDAPWQRGSVNFPLRKQPLISAFNSGFTLIIDGKVEGLQFSTRGDANTNAIINELSTKFGRPTSISKTTSTVAGIAVPAVHTEWDLESLYVSYLNIHREIGYGLLEIETPKMQAVRRMDQERKAADRQAL